MFDSKIQKSHGDQVYKCQLFSEGKQLEYGQVLNYRQEREGFRIFFADFLSAMPFSAFRWETPG